MVDFPSLHSALSLLLSSPVSWWVVIPGLLLGLVGGAMPGVSGSMVMAVVLPMTLYMDFLPAVILLTSIFAGAGFGGAVPAILMKIPGTPSAVATTFDGYPMTGQGRHNEALGLGLMASSLGAAVSLFLLLLLIAPLAWAVLRLGPAEYVVIAFWGLTLIAALREESISRGLLAGVIGVLVGTIGMTDTGFIRGTMGIDLLLDGVPPVPALLGLFVASQLFDAVGQDYIIREAEKRTISLSRILAGMGRTLTYPSLLIRGSLIGIFIGMVPGVGSSVSNLVSYADARRTDPNPETFGKGNPKGVVASEAANSSSEGGSLATLLALGIPGGGMTAIMLSAFAMHNIVGGPRFISDHRDMVYAVVIGALVGVLAMIVVGIPFIYAASRIVKVPMRFLIPSVMTLAIFGAYALTGNAAGPVTLFVFAIVGWFLQRFRFPVVATVVGLMLGQMVEVEMIRSYQISGGDPLYLFERPIALVFLALLIASLALPWWKERRRARARKAGLNAGTQAQ